MKAQDFCFWLQGVFEVADVKALDEAQVAIIKQHLGLVFTHDPACAHSKVPEFKFVPSPHEQRPPQPLDRTTIYC